MVGGEGSVEEVRIQPSFLTEPGRATAPSPRTLTSQSYRDCHSFPPRFPAYSLSSSNPWYNGNTCQVKVDTGPGDAVDGGRVRLPDSLSQMRGLLNERRGPSFLQAWEESAVPVTGLWATVEKDGRCLPRSFNDEL